MDEINYRPGLYGAQERDPYAMERGYFYANPHVAGMAAEDNAVVMNPYSQLSEPELNAVRMNESARINMRQQGYPDFDLTPEQNAYLNTTEYRNAPIQERNATIAARELSGDPTAGITTEQQKTFVKLLRQRMGM
jgi:hypothetical protein